jgi:hypothetical protein
MIEDGLWKIAAGILCVVLLFVVPTYLSYERQEEVIYHLVMNQVEYITERVRETGYLDQSMVNQLNDGLHSTGYFYEVEFEHLAKRFSDNGGKLEVFYEGTYTEDIIATLETGERYSCRVGDFFFIKVRNTTLSKSARLRHLFGSTYAGPFIFFKTGGIVRYGDT